MTMPPPLRVWLEPGYDHGRCGAWLLDLPGAFGWAAGSDAAVSQASSSAGWYRAWLERHGERLEARFGNPDVVEEVAAVTVDGYERNATFEDDRRPVEAGELEQAVRRLGYARQDLLALAERVDRFEAGGGRLPVDAGSDGDPAATPERTADELLRHVAGVEVWLGSRLDPTARFEDPHREGDVRASLSATREWAAANLARLRSLDPALARTDGKGESWTLRKVLRRYLYHSIDHLRELDRRLGRAEGRIDRLAFRVGGFDDLGPGLEPLVRLLRSVGWDRRTADPGRLRRAIDGSRTASTAWDGAELVGFSREIGDGALTAIVSMVVVDPRWQGMGVATRLVAGLMEGRPEIRFGLTAAGGVEPFYRRLGFEMDDRAMTRRRVD